MPPKQKKGKQKKESKKTIALDDVDSTVLTQEQLEQFCVDVYNSLVKEKQQSDFLRLERDKLTNMIAISHEQLVQAKHTNHDKQMEIDDGEEKHRIEMRQKREQLINLKDEKNTDSLNTKLTVINNMSLAQANHKERMDEILADIRDLKSELADVKDTLIHVTTYADIGHAEQKHELRLQEKDSQILIEQKWERKLSNELNSLGDKFKLEYDQLKNRKINEASQLTKRNEKFTIDLYHYYNKIIYHNLNLIKKLNSDLQVLKPDIAHVEKDLEHLKLGNESLIQSLLECKRVKQRLQERLASAAEDKEELVKTREELARKTTTLEDLKLELEVLNMAVVKQNKMVDKLAKEEDEENILLMTNLEEVTLVMEYMACHFRHKVDELNSLLKKLGSEKKIQSVLSPPEPAKDLLTWDLTSVANRHDQILQDYQQLLAKYDIHSDNTGFTAHLAEEILNRANYLRIKVSDDL